MGHLRVTIGDLKVTVVHLRVTIGSILVITFLSISKHKANITELHPKVRQTCLYCICLNFILVPSLGEDNQWQGCKLRRGARMNIQKNFWGPLIYCLNYTIAISSGSGARTAPACCAGSQARLGLGRHVPPLLQCRVHGPGVPPLLILFYLCKSICIICNQ